MSDALKTVPAESETEESSYNDVVEDSDAVSSDDWTPPTREEYEDLLAKKHRADAQAASRKRWLRDNGIDPKTGEKLNAEDEEVGETFSRADHDKAIRQAKAHERRLGIELPKALEEAGWNGRGLATIHKVLDLDAVDFDDDGTVGLTEQIAALKADVPELFEKRKTRTVPPAGAVGAGQKQSNSAGGHWTDTFRKQLGS